LAQMTDLHLKYYGSGSIGQSTDSIYRTSNANFETCLSQIVTIFLSQ